MRSRSGFTVMFAGVIGATLAVGFVAFLVDRIVRLLGDTVTETVTELGSTLGLAVSGTVDSVAAAVQYPNSGPMVVQPDANLAEEMGVTHWQQVPQWDGMGDFVPDPTDYDFPDLGPVEGGDRTAMIEPGSDLLAEIARMDGRVV